MIAGLRDGKRRYDRPVAEYKSMICTYKKKREDLRKEMKEKHNWNGYSRTTPKEYSERAYHIGIKIKIWKIQLKTIQNRERIARELKRRVEEFLGEEVTTKLPRSTPKLTHGIYFKYGMEQLGIKGRVLGSQIGITSKSYRGYAPYQVRLNFTRQFAQYPQNREMYYRFVNFMKENP